MTRRSDHAAGRYRDRSAHRRSTSSRVIRTGSASPRWPRTATTRSCWTCAGAFGRRYAALHDADAAHSLQRALAAECLPTRVVAGSEGLCEFGDACRKPTRVMAAIVGAAGLPRDARGRARGQAHPAREQGGAGHRRCAVHAARCARAAPTLLPIDSEHNAVFQCLPRTIARRPARRRRAAHRADRFRRPVPRPRRDVELARRDARRGMRASELGHGAQDLGRFGDDDEQGPGGHRGALAVRRAPDADRSRDPSGRASSIRSSNMSTARCSRSSAIPTCARRSRRRSRYPIASTPVSPRSTLARSPR